MPATSAVRLVREGSSFPPRGKSNGDVEVAFSKPVLSIGSHVAFGSPQPFCQMEPIFGAS